ncbi:MAG: hypothetical protein GC178_16615 [Flavobacteriales bacterium]|nr:hypothetical protein [Flavobacteriales bacterium]
MSVSLVSCEAGYSGHVEEVFPWDTIPLLPDSGIRDSRSGYYKWLYDDGKLWEVSSYCNGKRNGISLEFFNTGQLSEYSVMVNGKTKDDCMFDIEGGPTLTIFDRAFYFCQEDTIPCEVSNRVDSIFKKYESVSKIDWEAFFKNRTCD